MEKIVYCNIGERCKRVKYFKHENEADVECIRQALKKICETDQILSNAIAGKAIILQKNIPHKNKLCEIEDDEDIAHESEITCLCVPIPDVGNGFLADIAPGDYSVQDCGELYNVSSLATSDGTVSLLNNLDKLLDVENLTETSKTEMSSDTQVIQEPKPHSSEMSNKRLKTHHTLKLKSSPGSGSILHPAALPALTPDLENIRSTIGVLQGQKSFIYFWTSDLLKLTNGNPTKRDYLNYAMNIVATYPELRGGVNGCGIVRYQLSTNGRNRRANSKKSIAKASGSGSKSVKMNATLIMDNEPTDADDVDAHKELAKPSNLSDTAHVRQLLKATQSVRRQWIDKEAKNISDVVVKYPHMKIPNLVEFEFCMLLKVEKEQLYSKIDQMIEKLAKYFAIEQKDEESKAAVLVELWNTLTAKTQRKSCIPLLIIKEQMDSTTDLLSVKTASPRLVLYTVEGGIAAAFVIADETIRMKIDEPTVSKAVATLVASYFAWNTVYPPGYMNTLEYIESEIGRTSMKLKPTVEKFIRNLNQKLSSESET